MRRRMRRAPRPANADERSANIEVGRVLPDFEKRNARAFRESQFEIAFLGKSDQHFADQRRLFAMIQKLAVAGLPVRRRTDELMDRAAARHRQRKSSDSGYLEGQPLCRPEFFNPLWTRQRASLQVVHDTASNASASGAPSFLGTSVRRGQSAMYFCNRTSR